KVEIRNVALGNARRPRIFAFEEDDAFGVRKRKRTEENAVDEAEDSGIGADAERERNNGDSGEAFMLQQHAQAVADIVQKAVHKVSRLIGWPAFITKVTFCNAFRSSKGLPEF